LSWTVEHDSKKILPSALINRFQCTRHGIVLRGIANVLLRLENMFFVSVMIIQLEIGAIKTSTFQF
jgi:hypothetical protein